MAKGYFTDDQLTTPLFEVVQNRGTFSSPAGGTGMATDDYIGAVRVFAFNFAPGGYRADGSALFISNDGSLFNVEGSSYGAGATTFNLPNLQGTVAVGATNSAVGTVAGVDVVQVQGSQFPANLGGQSTSIPVGQPSLTLQYLICTNGYYPSSSSTATGAFLGEVIAFTGGYVPPGFTLADGRVLSVSANPALFSVLGITYGGNGSTTFKLPDLRGRDIVGAGPGVLLGSTVGQSTVALTQANLPVANGGSGQPFNDQEPGLALNYIVNVSNGIYPTRDNTGGQLGAEPYLGEVRAFAGPVNTIPQGWVLADGRSLTVAPPNYAIFSLLGTTYGGNGTTNFNVPNLVGKAVVGTGSRNGTAYNEGTDYGSNTANLVVTDATPCFCAGTAILTAAGEVPVEAIQPGDTVVTATGTRRRVRWVGHRSHAGRFLRGRPANWPVRFAAGSLGDGLPRRDLLVSQDHAMLLDGVLVPAGCLVNGSTIRVEQASARVDYHHIELDSHDAILAEGAPSETFLDGGNRGQFGTATLAAGAASPATLFCAPRLTEGPALEALRRRLALLAECRAA